MHINFFRDICVKLIIMGRSKTFDLDQVKKASFYYFSENRQNANVENIAVRAGMTRTQLQNHYKIEELRILAIEYALTLIVSDIFRIFSQDTPFELKLKLLILNLISKAKKNRYLTSFLLFEVENLDRDFVRKIKKQAKENIEPFVKEFEAQVEVGKLIDITPTRALIYIFSVACYPFIAQQTLQITLGINSRRYSEVTKYQIDEIMSFVLKGLKP